MHTSNDISVTTPVSDGTSPLANISLQDPEEVYEVIVQINREKAQLLSPVIIFTVVLMIVGLFGNPLAIYIYGWRWQKSTTRIFLFWLAILDLINCLITMPTEIYIMNNFYYFANAEVCRISRFTTYVINNASALIFVTIAIDRYIRICHPHKRSISLFEARVACGLSPCISIVFAWPALVLYGRKTVPMTHSGINGTFSGVICAVRNEMDNTPYPLAYIIYLWCGFGTCALILFVLYALIGQVMLKRNRRKSTFQIAYVDASLGEGRILSETTLGFSTAYSSIKENCLDFTSFFICKRKTRTQTRTPPPKSTLMMLAITAVFLITFLPFLIVMTVRQRVGPIFYPSLNPSQQIAVNFFSRSYLVNNCANPIVYGMCNSRFRDQVTKMFQIPIQRRHTLSRGASRSSRGSTF